MIRSAGILMPVTSLPSPYGIGTFSKEAREFVDFLALAGQTWWQILPLGPTGFGNSPYQSLSSYAGNPYLIDLETLIEEGYLKKEEVEDVDWFVEETEVDYGIMYKERYKVLRLACDRLPLKHPDDYLEFLKEEGDWLKDYAVFMAIKDDMKGESWIKWPRELRDHRNPQVAMEAERLKDDVLFYERIQYFFYKQMKALKKYANSRGIQIIGDLPFYVATDSIDIWSHPEQFDMDSEFRLSHVSGFPPDAGTPEGQKWGNPLFNWDRMRNEDYAWWMNRAQHQLEMYDCLRIDHFQGYERYFAIGANDAPAKGAWRKGPGLDLFRRMEARLGKQTIIVEDLGQLTPEFIAMVKESGYPGMRIIEYAFDPNDPGSIYMPFQYEKNTVAYTGTHDNDTLYGWLVNPDNKPRIDRAIKYLGLNDDEGYDWGILRAVYGSVSDLAIIQMQDLLMLDSECRMNDPSGKGKPWTWRMKAGALDKELALKLKEKMLLYCRNNWNAKVFEEI